MGGPNWEKGVRQGVQPFSGREDVNLCRSKQK